MYEVEDGKGVILNENTSIWTYQTVGDSSSGDD
jgi:hypothetical protein